MQDALSVSESVRIENRVTRRSEATTVLLFLALHAMLSWPSLYLYKYAADVPAVYLASGVAWAGFMLLSPKAQIWFGIGIFTSQLAGEFVVYQSTVTLALAFTLSRTFGAYFGARLLQRAMGHAILRPRVKDLLWFGLIACFAVPVVIMVPPHLVRAFEFDLAPYWLFALILIEAGGVLVMAPTLLFWLQPRHARISEARYEPLMITLAATVTFAFVYLIPSDAIPQHTTFYAVTPVMIWAAVRFGCRGAALISLVLTLVMIGSALGGLGPFSDESNIVLSVIELEIFILVVTGMSLLLGAYAEAREDAQRQRAVDKRRMQDLSLKLLHSEEQYRDSIATRLHDGIGQTLSLGRMRLDDLFAPPLSPEALAQRVGPIQDAFDTAISEVRDITRDVALGLYRGNDIAAVIHEHLANVFGGTDVDTAVHCAVSPKLDHETAIVVSRAVRECLVNVAKHAGAQHVRVDLMANPGASQFVAIISDDGSGFDASNFDLDRKGSSTFGLASVRSSMLALGGQFAIQSQPGKGTEVTLTLPLT